MYLPYRAGEDECQHVELYVSLCFIIDHQLKETITTAMLACSPVDKILVWLEILKAFCRSKYLFLYYLAKVLHCFSNFGAFLMLFSGKHFYKVVFIGSEIF